MDTATMMQLIHQALPVLLAAAAPFAHQLAEKGAAYAANVKIPAGLKPLTNGLIGMLVAAAMGGNPATGALVAHVVRSGLVHEPPTA